MNKIVFICAFFATTNCSAQMMPSAHRNDITTTNDDGAKRQQELDKEKALLAQSKKYKAPDLVSKSTSGKIKVSATTMNVYNPFVDNITVIVVYADNTKEDIPVASDKSAKLSRNENCKSIIVCGDKSNYNISVLQKGTNYDIQADGNCLGLKPSARFVK